MKFAGKPLEFTYTSPFTLQRGSAAPLTFILQPLSLGFHQRLRLHGILPPTAPLKVSRDSTGKPLRDAHGVAVTHTDNRDATYLTNLDRYHQRVAVLTVAESLQADPNVRFETPVPLDAADTTAWEQYADSLFQELEQAGFLAGDLTLLCREICRISNLLEQHLTSAQSSFSHRQDGNSA